MTAPGPATVGVLLLGRTAFRGATVASAPLLLAAWGADRFGAYAAALGTTLVLNPLVGSGVEKSALLLLPRSRRTGRRLLGAHVAVGAGVAAVSLLAVSLLALGPAVSRLVLLAAATNVALGLVQAQAALARAQGRPLADAAGYGVLAVGVAGGVAAARGGLGPTGYLALQATAAAAVTAALVVTLDPGPARPGRRLLRLTVRTGAYMGTNTLLATAAVSLVFGLLHGPAAGTLYLALTAYTVLGNLVDYLQRVYQPRLAVALATRPVALLAAARAATTVGLLALPLPLLVLVAGAPRLPELPAALVAVVAITPVLAGAAVLVWLLENLDAAALRRTTTAGLAGLAVTAVTGPLAVPALGAVGALLALLAGAAVQTLLLRPALALRPPPLLPTGRLA